MPVRYGKRYAVWTPEKVEDMKQMWLDGKSATQIALALDIDATRNAVIGMIHRRGLKRAAKDAPERAVEAKVRIRKPKAAAVPKALPAPLLEPIESIFEEPLAPQHGVTIEELAPWHCKWPSGDPQEPSFRYCGAAKTDPNVPYCCTHAPLAYVPKRTGQYSWPIKILKAFL